MRTLGDLAASGSALVMTGRCRWRILGPVWVPSPRPRSTLMSVMSSASRTSGTLGDITTAPDFDGKEGVDGSSPSEGFIGSPRYGGVSAFLGGLRPGDLDGCGAFLGRRRHPTASVAARRGRASPEHVVVQVSVDGQLQSPTQSRPVHFGLPGRPSAASARASSSIATERRHQRPRGRPATRFVVTLVGGRRLPATLIGPLFGGDGTAAGLPLRHRALGRCR
jgi:hypothetical protein